MLEDGFLLITEKNCIRFGAGYGLKPLYNGYLYRQRIAPRFRLMIKYR